MKKLIIKIIISIMVIGFAVGAILIFNNLTKPKRIDHNIDVNIILIDKDNNVLVNDNLEGKDKLLKELLEENYDVRIEKKNYGSVIYDFNEVKTDFVTSYISIYVDDKYSNYGIDYIQLYDKIKITFKEMMI